MFHGKLFLKALLAWLLSFWAAMAIAPVDCQN